MGFRPFPPKLAPGWNAEQHPTSVLNELRPRIGGRKKVISSPDLNEASGGPGLQDDGVICGSRSVCISKDPHDQYVSLANESGDQTHVSQGDSCLITKISSRFNFVHEPRRLVPLLPRAICFTPKNTLIVTFYRSMGRRECRLRVRPSYRLPTSISYTCYLLAHGYLHLF